MNIEVVIPSMSQKILISFQIGVNNRLTQRLKLFKQRRQQHVNNTQYNKTKMLNTLTEEEKKIEQNI